MKSKDKMFLITNKEDGISIVFKNIDALEMVTICNKVSISICNEANISRFKILRMFINTLLKNNMKVNNKNI